MAEPIRVTVPNSTPYYLRVLLALWLFCAFLTGVKFLPGLSNNLGPFEIVGVAALAAFLLSKRRSAPTPHHPLLTVLAITTVLAVLSQVRIPSNRALFGAIQVGILLFLLLFLVAMRHFLSRYQISPEVLLNIVTVSVLIVGPWVYIDGVSSGDIQAAGPFRNRAHMANYMLTAFWLVAINTQWPRARRVLKYAAIAGAVIALYAIAASGRRSVYLSLFTGLALWLGASLTQRRSSIRILVTALVLISVLLGLYRFGHLLGPQGLFFQQRVGLIDDRLRTFTQMEDTSLNRSFYQLQREGVMRAVRDAPILGIGWGGFPESQYSPTGHEVHSTPLRFLAELGFVGFALYAVFVGYLLVNSARLMLRMRETPYGSAYLILALGTWSMSVSHIYNRHITERTFWIYLAVFLALEHFAETWSRIQALVGEKGVLRNTKSEIDRIPTRSRSTFVPIEIASPDSP